MQQVVRIVLGWFGPIEKRSASVVLIFGLAMLGLKFLLARPFWASGNTRWVEFPTKLASTTTYLFENLFQLHFFWGTYPIPFPQFTAWMTGVLEIVLPVLLMIGLGTRLWALALLGMTCVIQLTFPDAFWHPETFLDSHSAWFLFSILIAIFGPGCFSLDWLVRRFAPAQWRFKTA
ncbi:MAG: DoxX family protein [Hyphomicrobiaceae bacterium]|nr:DoxX family protein [Hyphomicrobiaceae bacterium]